MKCLNCNTHMGCGCQKRVAKDGKGCCTKCVEAYNKSLAEKPKPQSLNNELKPGENLAPIINNVQFKR